MSPIASARLRAITAMCASTVATLAAQDAQATRGKVSQDALAQFVLLQRCAGDLLAVGRDYKAGFTREGVEFVPALGAGTPHNLPVRMRFVEVRRGERSLHEAKPVAPDGQSLRVTYARGEFDEIYDVRTDGLKQSFVFHRRPAGSGDLVVRLELATELRPTQHAGDHVELLAAGLGGVQIREVTAFDSAGRQCQGSMRLHGRQLDLQLDGAFVDGAALPLTLDPLIGSVRTVPAPAPARTPYECDVAAGHWSANGGTAYLVVFSASFSASDHDVYAVRFLPETGSTVPLAIDASPTIASRRPRVGYVASTNRYLVAWHDSSAARVLRDVRCVTVNANSMTLSGVVNIAASAADEFHVAVAGDVDQLSTGRAVVAWENDTGINIRQVTVPANGNPVPQAVTQLAAGVGANTPALSKSAEADRSLIAVWQAPGPIALDVFAQLLTRDLVRVGPVLSLGGGSPIDDREPAVDGSVIAWSRESSSFPTATFDLYCAFVERSPAGLTLRAGPRALATGSATDELGADVARLGSRHCVTYHALASDGTTKGFAWLVNDDCTVCNARMPLNVSPFPLQDSGLQPRIASAAVIGNGDGGLIACSNNPGIIQTTLRVQVVQNVGLGRPPIDAGPGCGPVTWLVDQQPFAIGNSRFFFIGTAPNLTQLVLAVGLPNSWVACGPCQIIDPFVVIPSATLGIGRAAFPVPCDPGYLGLTVEAQWLGLLPGSTFGCPLVPELSVSSRRAYTISD